MKILEKLLKIIRKIKKKLTLDLKSTDELYKYNFSSLIAIFYINKDIVNDNDLSIELIIKDALEIDMRITELIKAHNDNLKIFGSELRGIDDELDDLLVNICLDLLHLGDNIHLYNNKLSDFILRTEKRKRENKTNNFI